MAATVSEYEFDRFLRYDELTAWLRELEVANPDLVSIETYGRSYEGRDLLLATVTDSAYGSHDSKPAHWIDANIHAVELTASAAACWVLQHLVDGHRAEDETVSRALRTRTFYVVPRVNPDGAEWALADRPRWRRSSVRPWPNADDRPWPGLAIQDIDGDGRILQMRIQDPDGAWMPHPVDARLLIPVPPDTTVASGIQRYRVHAEGLVEQYDGFTVPTPRPPQGLDMNRNFPVGWATTVPGSGDHPLSEPEIDALVRAISARPNICGYNAFHTSGGVLLRPSSIAADSTLPPMDIWVYGQLAARGTELTGYTMHSVYEDFTFDTSDTMSGAADDWAYEHLGVYAWTTEFWDIVHAATGVKQSTHLWYTGPSDDEALAVLQWLDEQPASGQSARADTAGFVDWYPFDHPQFGRVDLGGWNDLYSWTNPPPHRLRGEIARHADFAVFQALASPRLEIKYTLVEALGEDTWRVEVGVANTGWLPTHVTARAATSDRVSQIIAELTADTALEIIGSDGRQQLGQLAGGANPLLLRARGGLADRVLCTWIVRAPSGTEITVTAKHDRSGRDSVTLRLE